MDIGKFTDKERLVFYNLLKHPDYGDKKISEVSGVKASTVSAIKRRFKEEGLFRSIIIPAINKIGYELIMVSYGRFSPTADRKAKEAYFRKISEDKNIFYAVEGGNIVFIISVARNYSEVKKTIDSYTYFLNAHNLADNTDWHFLLFPFEVSKLINYFDYHHIFAQMFDMEDSVDVDVGYEDCTPYHLSKKEKQALYGMIKFPDKNDLDIAREMALSRQGFSNMKSRFKEVGLVSRKNVLDLQKLGIDILALSHSRFNPRTPLKERSYGIRKILESTPQLLMLSGNFENLMVGAFRNYEHFNRVKLNALKIYREHDFLRGEPDITLIPMQSARIIKELDFSEIMEQVLNLER